MADIAVVVLWACCGIFPALRWLFRQRSVSMLDVVAFVLFGAAFGPIIPLLQLLHSIKLKGGQHGAE